MLPSLALARFAGFCVAISLTTASISTAYEAPTGTKLVLAQIFGKKLSIDDVPHLKRRARRGNSEAQFLMFRAYSENQRYGAPPWVSGGPFSLVSRQEAVSNLTLAADAGHPEAAEILARAYLQGNYLAQDAGKALIWLYRAHDRARDVKTDLLLRHDMAVAYARLPDLTESDRRDAIDHADAALAGGLQVAIRAKAAIIGRSDPGQARDLLEQALSDNPAAALPLARMLIAGQGGAQNLDRARDLLAEPYDDAARAELGLNHLPGGILASKPRDGLELMAAHALVDRRTRHVMARHLRTYFARPIGAETLFLRMLEDADTGTPDEVLDVLRLHQAHSEGFRSDAAWFDLIQRYGDAHPQIGVLDARVKARFALLSDGRNRQFYIDATRRRLKQLQRDDIAEAYTLHAELLKQGVVYPRDYQHAVQMLRRGAMLGDPEAAHGLGSAYAQGMGADKNQREAIRWFRAAARAGSVKARYELTRRFSLTGLDSGVTLGEGISAHIAMYGDTQNPVTAMMMGGFFAGAEGSGLKAAEILAPVYDGFRISPAAADDKLLVPLIKNTPDWIWKSTETLLLQQDYWQGDPTGQMGPDARDAFRKFIADAGAMTYDAIYGEPAPLGGQKSDTDF